MTKKHSNNNKKEKAARKALTKEQQEHQDKRKDQDHWKDHRRRFFDTRTKDEFVGSSEVCGVVITGVGHVFESARRHLHCLCSRWPRCWQRHPMQAVSPQAWFPPYICGRAPRRAVSFCGFHNRKQAGVRYHSSSTNSVPATR